MTVTSAPVSILNCTGCPFRVKSTTHGDPVELTVSALAFTVPRNAILTLFVDCSHSSPCATHCLKMSFLRALLTYGLSRWTLGSWLRR